MCIKFSDDLGIVEEAVDLGGSRTELLLMEVLALSPMFEGRDDKLNLALDSSGIHFILCLSLLIFILHIIHCKYALSCQFIRSSLLKLM